VDPHSAFTAVFNLSIDGGLVDGPVYASIFNQLRGLRIVNGDEYAEFQSDLCVYHDDYGDYSTNEPTMDGTASLSYYFSSLEQQSTLAMEQKYLQSKGAIIRGDVTAREIHLVFTGHDYRDGGNIIRETLKKQRIPAHFFFTGDFYRDSANRKLIKALLKEGHYLGAHSDKHLLYAPWENRDSLLIGKEEFISDLRNNYREMAKFGISKEEARLFLPPYEWYNEIISQWTSDLGLTLINLTPGTYSNADYTTPEMGLKYVSSDSIFQRILRYERLSEKGLNGCIMLFHIGTHPARTDKFYDRLEGLVVELKKRGYRFTLMQSG